MPKTANQIFAEKVAFLLEAEKTLDKAVIKWQRDMYELLLADYLPLFDYKEGFLLDTPKNSRLLLKIDNLFDSLQKALNKDVLGVFAADMLTSASMSADYYIALGFEESVISSLLTNKIDLEIRLGIKPDGTLDKRGYLYRLGKTTAVRQKLADYVVNSLTGDVSSANYAKGLKDMIVGTKALDTVGSMQKYFQDFAYDSYNEFDAVVNKQFATNLNLNHFIYEGSLIKTSRRFCQKRAGKPYSVEETKDWKNDPDLIDKKTKSSYKPLVERGRYRCRHFIKYITGGLYKRLKNGASK